VTAAGAVDGTLLALAGLKRLGMTDLISASQLVPAETMLPAVAQGAIGIQCRRDDARMMAYLNSLNHADTKVCVDCERAFLKALDGNCRTPIAGQASITGGVLNFKGFLSRADGSESVFVERSGAPGDCEDIGRAAAEEVRQHLGPEKFREFQQSFDEAIEAHA
jgi:hydroxymethylbilane synthase